MLLDVRHIRNEDDYAWALGQVEAYFDNEPTPGTPDAERFEILSTLISAYEKDAVPVDAADPVSVLWFAIENMGRSQAELADLIGSRSRASEILNRRRRLNLEQIRAISSSWKIPIEALIGTYNLDGQDHGPKKTKQREYA
ncbi:conserved hypothetical protein [Methylobacterium sp. 4-46]|uniref:helix-turn-helix domain-containing protein n=1 Tax=unclassified Methylobacterium TaxID=2615210 RepID=UPI000165C81D|nr:MULTISPECIES: helix-turn-helix domain-containing protein [Methylobacterium]ACA15674.1 conserved hypothetical protein [Methylobacterium sp. 4-46]WFT81386.1 transcriptional regulator [Methylobacterium nodulans]